MTDHSEWRQHKVLGHLLCEAQPTDLSVGRMGWPQPVCGLADWQAAGGLMLAAIYLVSWGTVEQGNLRQMAAPLKQALKGQVSSRKAADCTMLDAVCWPAGFGLSRESHRRTSCSGGLWPSFPAAQLCRGGRHPGTLPGSWATWRGVAAVLITLQPLFLQIYWYHRREWEWEVGWALWEGKQRFQTGDTEEGIEPRPPAILCQKWGLVLSQQVQQCLYIAYSTNPFFY